MEELHCIGCGVEIQTTDQKGLGFTPASSLENEIVYCRRCFRLKNYNEVADTTLTNDDFLKILQSIAETNALVINIIDIFDVHGTMIQGLMRHIGGNDLIVVANKMDLLPKSVNPNKVKHWLNKEVRDMGKKPVAIELISSTKGHGIDELMAVVEGVRNGRDVYVVGCTNTGKSTFINRLIRQNSFQKELITTSHFPGTTLNMIEIPLDDTSAIVDTPGIINAHQLVHYIGKQDFKVVMPKKEIKPASYQLNPEQSLFIGGLVRFDFVSGMKTGFVLHFSNQLQIHRTKFENADEIWEKHAGEMLIPVIKKNGKIAPFKKHELRAREGKVDVVISGLGFVTFVGTGQTVQVYAPEGVGVFLRDAII